VLANGQNFPNLLSGKKGIYSLECSYPNWLQDMLTFYYLMQHMQDTQVIVKQLLMAPQSQEHTLHQLEG
jgi:hypothetical protein